MRLTTAPHGDVAVTITETWTALRRVLDDACLPWAARGIAARVATRIPSDGGLPDLLEATGATEVPADVVHAVRQLHRAGHVSLSEAERVACGIRS